jgi:glycosyltransferase involved in cell wall biosynthesis
VLADAPVTGTGPVRFVVIDDTAGQDPEIATLRDLDDVSVFRPPFNLGHQRALVYALRKALSRIGDDDAVVTLDADGEDRPEDLPRLLAQLNSSMDSQRKVVLALRTKRRESFAFKVFYRLFRLLFRSLTGATVRSGNFAAMPGSIAKRALLHPTFDLSYSSAILALDLPVEYVPCERGERYEGRSKMTYGRLAMHGLRMLMPFTDRIAIRALATFVFFGARRDRDLPEAVHFVLDPGLDQLHRPRGADRLARRTRQLRQSLRPLLADPGGLACEHRGVRRSGRR